VGVAIGIESTCFRPAGLGGALGLSGVSAFRIAALATCIVSTAGNIFVLSFVFLLKSTEGLVPVA